MTKTNNNISKLRDQIINFFPSYYMTLISIIQATALGYLLITFSHQLEEGFSHPSLYVIYGITFFVIIIVWYEYMMGSASLRWLPSILDSVIPFSLGIGQFFLVITASHKLYYEWYFSLSGVCFVAFFAYINMYLGAKKLKKYNSINQVVLKELKEFPVINYIFTLGYLIIFLLFTYYEYVHKLNSDKMIYATLGLMIIFLMRGLWYWHKIIQMIK